MYTFDLMNYALAREIYGGLPFMVDRSTFVAQSQMLKDFRTGAIFEKSDTNRLNSCHLIEIQSGVKVIGSVEGKNGKSTDQLVSIINLNGPIVKNGGMSSYGMKELADQLLEYDSNDQIMGHIIMADSGGGSAAGMEVFTHALDQVTKPKVAVVERGGGAYSAAYGIIAHTDRIYAESEKSGVGSIGSMISFKAQPNKTVNANGEKQVTIYATPSTKKNKWFEDALNDDNYELALSEVLNPHVEDFRQDMRDQRPGITESQLDGSDYDAGEVIGSLVDEIGGLPEAIAYIKGQSSQNSVTTIQNNNKNKITAMTAQEILAQHPAAHAEIFGAGRTAGVTAESERTKVWLTHLGTDPKAVVEGIKGGQEISASQREEFLVKSSTKEKLDDLATNSAAAVVVEESAATAGAAKTEVSAFYEKVRKGLKS